MHIHQQLLELRKKETQLTSKILDKLQEMETSKDYLKMGYNSLFDYLVRGLKYSEATAYQRQACVRLAAEIPEIKQKIDSGSLSVTAVTMAFKHIRKQPTIEKLKTIEKIQNKSTREVKKLFAQPMMPLQVKKIEYKDKVYLRLELTHAQNQKLEKLKSLKSHKYNVESLLTLLIDKELKKFENSDDINKSFEADNKAKTLLIKSNNPRQISKRLRNYVLHKAKTQCQFPGCTSRHYLQIDHILPVRLGGNQSPGNLQVLCGAHNRLKG